MPGASVPRDRLLSNQMSRLLALFLGFDGAHYFINLSATEFVRQAGMIKIGFVCMNAFDSRIDEARAVLAQGFEERARVPAVLGTCTLVAGIECSIAPIRSEVGTLPQCHQSEHARPDAPFAGWPVAFEQM